MKTHPDNDQRTDPAPGKEQTGLGQFVKNRTLFLVTQIGKEGITPNMNERSTDITLEDDDDDEDN